MIENIDKVLDRGDRLELLVDKTANMQGNTFRFRKQARRFRSTVWWRNVKLTYVFESNMKPKATIDYDLEDSALCVLLF